MALKSVAGKLVAGAAVATFGASTTTKCAEPDTRGPVFDPEALERGAKALREINNSPNAKQVIELSKQQEITKQAEAKSEEQKNAALAAQFAVEREKIAAEEQRKTAEQNARYQAQLAQYEDELARKRQEQEHELHRQRNAELVKMQEQSAYAQEEQRRVIEQQIQAERRATEKHRADLQKEVEREKALAEAEGRAKERRSNEDVNRRELLLKMEEERKKAMELINATFTHLGAAATDLLTDRDKMAMLVLGGSALALGYFAAREGTSVAGKAISAYMGTPKLIRETSRPKPWSLLRSAPKGVDAARGFSDVILPERLHDEISALAASTTNTKRHGAPFRHMLFYGPPGTGKSLAAKRLARTSGLHYAILSGGDVAPLGSGAVTQLHELFDWAEATPSGLLLFIDEADAFLGRRGHDMSEGLRGALNAMLFRTGDQSRDFVVVLATNRPGDLDAAVLDRMDEVVEFPIPGEEERMRLFKLYLEKYIMAAGTDEGGAGAERRHGLGSALKYFVWGRKLQIDPIQVQGVGEEELREAARLTEGFSAREIAKTMAAVQSAGYGTPDAVLTAEVFRDVIQRRVREHGERRRMESGELDRS